MSGLFALIDQIAIGIYILIGAVVVWNLRRLLVAQTEYRATYFELERNIWREKQGVSLTRIILALQFALVILGVQQVIVPFFRTEESLSGQLAAQVQVEDAEFNTATPAPVGDAFDIEPVAPFDDSDDTVLLLTPTLTPTPVGTIIPNAPAVEGCTDERAQLQVPANGMRVFQPIVVVGQAYTDDFSKYKIEIKGPSTNDNWVAPNEVGVPAREMQSLYQFNPATYSQGEYQFRLVVFDVTDTIVAACMVTIYISPLPESPTPTPLPEGGAGGPVVPTATPQP